MVLHGTGSSHGMQVGHVGGGGHVGHSQVGQGSSGEVVVPMIMSLVVMVEHGAVSVGQREQSVVVIGISQGGQDTIGCSVVDVVVIAGADPSDCW